jgi:hypothetical protein
MVLRNALFSLLVGKPSLAQCCLFLEWHILLAYRAAYFGSFFSLGPDLASNRRATNPGDANVLQIVMNVVPEQW